MSSRSRVHLCALGVLSWLALTGCTQLPVRDYVKMTGNVDFGAQDKITLASDARSVFALLKDVNHFPDENYSDIFVREKSLELVGPLGGPATGIDNAFLKAREDAIARSIPGLNSGVPAAATRTPASDDQGVIWFEKISAIEVSEMELYLQQGGDYVPDMRGFICLLRMTNGAHRYFRSTNEGDIKRLAAAFSFFSGAAVMTPHIYPQAGARISPRDALLVAIEIEGPFEKAGIPIGAKVLGIDGVDSTDPASLIKALGELKSGKHPIKFMDPKSLTVMTKAIDLGTQP